MKRMIPTFTFPREDLITSLEWMEEHKIRIGSFWLRFLVSFPLFWAQILVASFCIDGINNWMEELE